ncbi:MAG: glycoside hydrolase family 127 protein [Gemmatimonadales bacterium]
MNRERHSTYAGGGMPRRSFLKKAGAGAIALSVYPVSGTPLGTPSSGPGAGERGSLRNRHYVSNREPLMPNRYVPLPLGSVRPAGWLRAQLEGWAGGMTGQLDEIWPDVGPENGWLGGAGDVWERGPYWLDGLVPLAHAVQDERLIAKASAWIEATLASRRSDGFFGPEEDRLQRGTGREAPGADWWPRMVMLKVLQQHHDATGDERVLDLMRDYFHFQARELPAKPLGHFTFWGQRRGGENLASIHWLYNRTGDAFLLDLGELVFQQTEDWTARFSSEHGIWHVVNTAMGIKQPGVWYQQSGEKRYLTAIELGIDYLMTRHGQVEGIWSGDELLHGTEPTQGVETCAVVEYMFSLESLLPITGSVRHADRLERVAYNALPAALSPRFAGRHYYQMPNQVACTREPHNFSVRHDDDTLIGLETGYGCCTANLHQGWPKLTAHLWMATPDDGLAALVYAPCEVTARVADGVEVRLVEETDYPFEDTVRFVYHGPPDVAFPLHLRIPLWCESAELSINGQPLGQPTAGSVVGVDHVWSDGDRLELHLPAKLSVSRWHERSAAIERGPLVFALRRRERWTAVKGSEPYADYEIRTDEPWNYGLLDEDLQRAEESFQFVAQPPPDRPWSAEAAPIQITARARRIPEWQRYVAMAGPIPWSPIRSAEPDETVTLVPYGCTEIRIAEFPVVV